LVTAVWSNASTSFPESETNLNRDVEIDIEMYLGFVVSRYKKFQIILIQGAIGLYVFSIVVNTDV